MKKRNIVTAALALAAAAYFARGMSKMLAEWARYEKMREMSDEGPMIEDLPDIAKQTLLGERDFLRELATFATKAPYELARYLRMETM